MMAEHQSRERNISRDPTQRPTSNFVKTTGVAVREKTPGRPKSKNTLPKNLRYDLENALVGLCDVWFEEIKPYLERNNIKVHVHESTAGNGQGDSARCVPGVPECEHLHPASSAPRCELCRLLFNAANSIESAVSQAASVSAHCAASPDQTGSTANVSFFPPTKRKACIKSLNDKSTSGVRTKNQSLASLEEGPLATRIIATSDRQRHKSNEEIDLRPVIRVRRNRKKKTQASHSRPLVPRLCQTYSQLPDSFRQQKMQFYKAAPINNQRSPNRNNIKIGRPKNKPELKDASTQTEALLMIKTLNPTPRKSLKSSFQFGRSAGTTAFLITKNKNNAIKDIKNIKIPDTEVPPLFKNDLIDIIAEKQDKRLRILYKSPERPDTSRYSSSLNLFSPYKPGKSQSRNKTRPWR